MGRRPKRHATALPSERVERARDSEPPGWPPRLVSCAGPGGAGAEVRQVRPRTRLAIYCEVLERSALLASEAVEGVDLVTRTIFGRPNQRQIGRAGPGGNTLCRGIGGACYVPTTRVGGFPDKATSLRRLTDCRARVSLRQTAVDMVPSCVSSIALRWSDT